MDFCANCSHGCKTKRAPTAVQVLVALQALQVVALAMLGLAPQQVTQALPLLVPTVLALLTVLATWVLVLLMAVLTTEPRTGRK